MALLKKDALLEVRSLDTVVLLCATGILLSALAGAGVSSSFLEPVAVRKLFPSLVWLIFLFSCCVAVMRPHEYETEYNGIAGVLLSGAGAGTLFLSKVIVLSVLLMTGFEWILISSAVLLNVRIWDHFGLLSLIALPVAVGCAALATILSAVVSHSRARGPLFTIVSLPLLFPLFCGGLQLSSELIELGRLDFWGPWVSLLVAADIVYIGVGANLYGFALKD